MTTGKPTAWLTAANWIFIAAIIWFWVLTASQPPVAISEPPHAPPKAVNLLPQPQRPALLTVHNATPENLARLGEAVRAFDDAELEVPAVDVWFHSDREPCGERRGRFIVNSDSWQIRICSSEVETVYEHELAHAWVTANVTETQQSQFMNMRDIDHWSSREVPWNERGTEWAAVVIQQGVSGLPLPPAISSEVRSRLQAFELLTGRVAPVLVDWITERDVRCSDRPTALSKAITDVTGRSCFNQTALSGAIVRVIDKR